MRVNSPQQTAQDERIARELQDEEESRAFRAQELIQEDERAARALQEEDNRRNREERARQEQEDMETARALHQQFADEQDAPDHVDERVNPEPEAGAED